MKKIGSFQEISINDFWCLFKKSLQAIIFGKLTWNLPTAPGWNKKETQKKRIFLKSNSNDWENLGVSSRSHHK